MIDSKNRKEFSRSIISDLLSETTDFKSVSEDVLNEVVLKSINRYQNKLCAGVLDSIDDLLAGYKSRTVESLLNSISGWQVAVESPFLLPENCRFCFSKGSQKILVIEQPPSVRRLMFDFSNGKRLHDLSLPYCIFVIHITDGLFKSMYCGWTCKSLKSLDDQLCHPLLPNMHDNMAVCLGYDFVKPTDRRGLSQLTEEVQSFFWSSVFNNDLSTHWRGKSKIHPSLVTVEEWQAATIKNPEFILDCNLTPCKTVSSIINSLCNDNSVMNIDNLRADLMSSFATQNDVLTKKILCYFKSKKFDKCYPDSVKAELGESIRKCTSEILDLLKNLESLIKEDQETEFVELSVDSTNPYWEDF